MATKKKIPGKRRESKMRRFKIKYTSTKGELKTRNIKATSEEKAMSEITDMTQHHYTITEGLDDKPATKENLRVREPFEVGDTVICIKDGFAHWSGSGDGKNEPYFKDLIYECSHFWGEADSTCGIKGIQHIVDKEN